MYLDMLNEVLADRIISEEELEELKNLISNYSLAREEVLTLHRRYLKELIYIYLLDNKISDFESTDISDLASMFGLTKEVPDLIEEVKADNDFTPSEYDVEGKSICFTGKLKAALDGLPVSRTIAQSTAQRKGMIIKKITKIGLFSCGGSYHHVR